MASETTHSRPRGAPETHVESEPGVTLDPTAAELDQPATTSRSLSVRNRARAYSLERTILEAQVAALERELARKERERQDIIDQYEHALTEQRRDDGVAIPIDDDQSSLLGELRQRLTSSD